MLFRSVGGDDQLEELMARRKCQMQSAEETNHTFMDFSMKQDEQKPVEEVGSETTEAVSEEPQALHLESVESVNFDSDLIPEEDFLSFEEDEASEEPAVEEVSEPELETAITVEAAQEDVFSAVEDDLFEEEQPVINLDKQVKGAGYESACEEQVSDTQEVVRTICDEKRVYYRVTIR